MSTVLVKNKNEYDYQEKFEGDIIKIPAGGYFEMDYEKATMFLGTFAPPKLGVNGEHLPQGFKMLEIVKKEDFKPEVTLAKNKCLACNYQATSDKDLDEHTLANHSAQMVKDDLAEDELKKRPRGRPRADV